ncbi:MAG: HAMP domain-containing sensor histidine kinase [Verrucomicrobiota bacterium]|jgi:signal transduction histidine kinase
MTSQRPTRKPAFLWQAGLILLPVVIIAAVALTAIIENRTAVEREARRRAEEVARQYGKELEHPWGGFLIQPERYSQRWSVYLADMVGGWPGSVRRGLLEAEAAHFPERDPRAELAEWQAQYPGWRAEEVFPDSFRLTVEGRFHPGLEFNPAPQPPAWFTALSPAQRAAWESLKATAASGAGVDEVEQRVAQFQETGPEPEAGMNAAFIALRARLPTLPPEKAVAEALRSADENWETLSETGLPLANLAFGEALRYARATGPTEALWKAIPNQVLRAPSPLTPALLDQLEALAGTNTTLQAGVTAWRTLYDGQVRLHDIAEAVRQTGKLRGLTTANLWIEHDQTRWLCLLNYEYSVAVGGVGHSRLIERKPVQSPLVATDAVGGVVHTRLIESTNELWTDVQFLPKSVVEQALVRALENSEVKLPGYLGLAAWLEGEPLTLPERWSPGRDTNSAPLLLAQANGGLSCPGKFRKRPDGPAIDWDGLPGHPRFVLQLYVADPALLYSSYWRHALLLAGLVAASAFAALVGVIASWRAFRRQLRLNELKSNFVSSVSHELRSPIASVRLMAESLERGKVSEAPKQQEYFRFIVQECRRLSALIENVLDFSRIEQGRKQYDFEPTDLVALTQQTVKLMETYAAERQVKLNLQLQLANAQPSTAHQPPAINYQLLDYQLPADGKALQQALVNLIDNALKHSPKGETVTVGLQVRNAESEDQPHASRITHHASRITHHASRISLWVEDHGEGIPTAEHEKVFERFYRRGSELRRQTQGVGIGLSIVKHIVEAHGGKVLVRSAPGQGSRFTIELPVSETNAKPESRNPKPE